MCKVRKRRKNNMGRTHRCRKRRKLKIDKADNRNYNDLQKYLSARGWQNATNLKIGNFDNMGCGIYSKLNLEGLLIELPVDCLMSYYNIESDLDFKNLFNESKLEESRNEISFQSLLAFYLSYHKLMESPDWLHYLKSLPETFSNPYFCKKTELHFLDDLILEKIVEQNDLIKKNLQKLVDLLKVEHKDLINIETFKWCYFACNTRSVYLNASALNPMIFNKFFKKILSDLPNMGLAPFLDYFNHSSDVVTRSQLSCHENFIEKNLEQIKSKEISLTYQLYSDNSWEKGQQIFINYGSYNNTKLLIEYGFFVPNNNKNFLDFSLNDINSYIKRHPEYKFWVIPKHKYKFIKDHDLDQQIYIDLTDGLSHNFQAILAILLIPSNLYNLTQVAFGDDINFQDIKQFSVEILNAKITEYGKLTKSLEKINELSESGRVCSDYYRECCGFIEKVLDFLD